MARICLPRYGTGSVLQQGDQAFDGEMGRLYDPAENEALDGLVRLKTQLRNVPHDDFFTTATEGMASLLGAEMAFIFKRLPCDDLDPTAAIAPYGEPGSCVMAAAFHYCSNVGSKTNIKNTKFAAHACPCAYMRHDKVFLISERLGEFITNNPNHLPTPAEAYIAVPLLVGGKCLAHFGVMWSAETVAQRKLSWAFVEALLHSLEDMVLQRLLPNLELSRGPNTRERQHSVVAREAAAISNQSLRPYAGSLSHELRTPLQGIVGMLDIVYANVQEAVHVSDNAKMRQLLQEMKEHIEVVQDSSRRVVEAADNVVHAYDMNMSVPDIPSQLPFEDADTLSPLPMSVTEMRPDIVVAGSNLPLSRPNKRRRDETISRQSSNASATKFQRLEGTSPNWFRTSGTSHEIAQGLCEAEDVQSHAVLDATVDDAPTREDAELAKAGLHPASRVIAPGLRHTDLREVLQYVINEGLKTGGRPDSALPRDTEHGQVIEVRSRGSDGTAKTKIIEWSVDPAIPQTLFIDEKDLSKLISCVVLNAIKFTDQDGGRIRVRARMGPRDRYIAVKVSDNGPGIPAAFLPNLYKPFSRENASITRQSEGLGLGLLVGKGLARKLGGDLQATKATTHGPEHGTDFDIKVPIVAGETITRSNSPFTSPMPKHALPHLHTPNTPPSQHPTSQATSPTRLSHALQEVIEGGLPTDRDVSLPTPSPKSNPRLPVPAHVALPVTVTSSPPTPPHISSHGLPPTRPRLRKSASNPEIDRDLAAKHPLTFLVAEDNKINRRLLVSMLGKFGYKAIYEAHDGAEAVRQMRKPRDPNAKVDVVLMDLWMPLMDGYEATERILGQAAADGAGDRPTVLAVTADVTDGAQERAAKSGMKGFMTKPYKMHDLQRLITEYCASHQHGQNGQECSDKHDPVSVSVEMSGM